MRRVKAIIATTHLDLHGDRMAPSALEGIVDQIHEKYIPVLWNHDIHFSPLGRSISATLVPLSDGELALETESEYWDAEDSLLGLTGDGRLRVAGLAEMIGCRVDVSVASFPSRSLTSVLTKEYTCTHD